MNQLKYIEEFRAALSDYHLSDQAKKTVENLDLVLLVGPSSSGRNTIINQLVSTGPYFFVVSDTTRKPRINNGILEQNGREYWFRSEEEVLKDVKAGQFLEAAIIHNQQVSGISVRELETAAQQHKIAINEVEVVGADNIHDVSPKATFLFVVPPSFDEWMARMNSRGELPPDEARRRLESAVNEISTALERDFYHFVVNDTFMHAARHIDAVIREHIDDQQAQAEAKVVAKQLRADTRQYLSKLA